MEDAKEERIGKRAPLTTSRALATRSSKVATKMPWIRSNVPLTKGFSPRSTLRGQPLPPRQLSLAQTGGGLSQTIRCGPAAWISQRSCVTATYPIARGRQRRRLSALTPQPPTSRPAGVCEGAGAELQRAYPVAARRRVRRGARGASFCASPPPPSGAATAIA